MDSCGEFSPEKIPPGILERFGGVVPGVIVPVRDNRRISFVNVASD